MKKFLGIFLVFLIVSLVLNLSTFSVEASPDGWVSPSGFEDPDSKWSNEVNAYDEDTASYTAHAAIPADTWGSYLVLTIDEITSDILRIWNTYSGIFSPGFTQVDIYNGSWYNIYDSIFIAGAQFSNYTYSETKLTAMRVRYKSSLYFASTPYVNEVDFWEIEAGGEEYERSASQEISMSSSSSRMLEASRTTTQGIGFSVVGNRLIEVSKNVAQTVTTSFNVIRLGEYARGISQGISVSFSGESLLNFVRSTSQAITVSVATQRLIEVMRTAFQTITFSLESIEEKVGIYLRDASLPLNVALQSLRLTEIFKGASQTINMALQSSMIPNFVRVATQTIVTSLNAERLAQFLRLTSQGITLDFQSIGEKTGLYLRNVAITVTVALQSSRLAEYFKTATETINFVFGTSRIREVFREATQTLTTVFNGERIAELFKVASQTIMLSLQSIGEKIGDYFRSASQAINVILTSWIEAELEFPWKILFFATFIFIVIGVALVIGTQIGKRNEHD